MNERIFVCKRTRMAQYLTKQGFEIKSIEPDEDNPTFSVYLFDASPELYNAVLDYTSGKGAGVANVR